MSKLMREQVSDYILALQEQIVSSFESLDPNAPRFKHDSWVRPEGGEGKSCVFAVPASASDTTTILEKAGVNISIVHGKLPPAAIKQMRADHSSMPLPENPGGGLPFFAAGISLVIHPRNPHAPTVHANYRYFEITEPETAKLISWWFGGGADLTPSYLYTEDAVHFHSTLQKACASHGSHLYPAFKKWCDEYFYIPHRQESRGIGGIFFDDLNEGPHLRLPSPTQRGGDGALRPTTPDEIFALIRSLGDAFIPSYLPVLSRRHAVPYTPHHRRWQLIRRGRYVEFNLIYDRGTKFGLMTPGARVESILMSLPETARWEYQSELGEDWQQDEGRSEEGELVSVLRNPREWVDV